MLHTSPDFLDARREGEVANSFHFVGERTDTSSRNNAAWELHFGSPDYAFSGVDNETILLKYGEQSANNWMLEGQSREDWRASSFSMQTTWHLTSWKSLDGESKLRNSTRISM